MWAISYGENGFAEFIGEATRPPNDTSVVRIRCFDAMLLYFGHVVDGGVFEDVPVSRVKIYRDKIAFQRAIAEALSAIWESQNQPIGVNNLITIKGKP